MHFLQQVDSFNYSNSSRPNDRVQFQWSCKAFREKSVVGFLFSNVAGQQFYKESSLVMLRASQQRQRRCHNVFMISHDGYINIVSSLEMKALRTSVDNFLTTLSSDVVATLWQHGSNVVTSLLSYVAYVPSCLTCLHAFCVFAPSRLMYFRAFAPYTPSCLTCLRALRALIFTFLNYASCGLYLLFPRLTYLRLTHWTKAILKCPKGKLKRSSVWNFNGKSFWLIFI